MVIKFIYIFYIGKEKANQAIKEAARNKKDIKQITAIFTILDYFLFAKENSFLAEYKGITFANNFSSQMSSEEVKQCEEDSEEMQSEDNMTSSNMNFKQIFSKQEIDLDNAYKTPKGEEIIDTILAMAIYWVLSFDWQVIGEFIKDYAREDPTKEKTGLTSVLIKQLGKYSNPTKMSIFSYFIHLIRNSSIKLYF